MNQMVIQNLQRQLDLEANPQVIERQIKDNLENGEEYVWLIETSYWNVMLDKQVLRIEERLARLHVVSTTITGMAWSMEWGSSEKAH